MSNNKEQVLRHISFKEILSFKEALIYMDVSPSFLYKLTSKRIITFFKPSGKRIYFKRSDLDKWMTLNKCESWSESLNQVDSFISKSRNDD